MHDSPQQHPRISDEEKKYIVDSIAGSIDDEATKIPWKDIIKSGPVWVSTAAHWSGCWGFLTLLAQAPSYFNFIHGWDINAVSLPPCNDIFALRYRLIEIFIPIVYPGRILSRSAAPTPHDLLVLLLDDERLATPHEQDEPDEHEKTRDVRVRRRSRLPHYSPRIQRMPAAARGLLHDDRHHGKRRGFCLQLGELC